MPKIFISYRHDDSAFVAQPIYEKLKERFGEESVVYDVEFPLGVDFAKQIDEAVGECDVLLAIIGDRWLSIRFEDGPMKGQRRLDDPNDYVRLEIASALKRDIPVIPVLVGKISMPDISQGLLADVADLTKKQAASVRAGRDLTNDLQLLVRGVKRALRLPPLTPSDLALPPGIKVVPQGLRSFDEKDNGFFTYLLPGPYQDGGLPERLCFWKTRIEATISDTTFRVGLIYGPSGCGKSSLVKAGLLPCLASHVTSVYVEALATGTEVKLLAALHEHCPYLKSESSLQVALSRKDQIPGDKKVLIILDQFEQYLHSTPEDEQDELAEVLRECDGEKLQCILMVRDDFLTPVTRFMDRLSIPMAGDRNLALVDLFEKRHAKKVLALLGQAYGGLPQSGRLTREQDAFLNQAVGELAEGDHVISVRLALFAQMVKDKEWKPAILKEVGGATGVGVAFLEDSFVAKSAPEDHRCHRIAAQKVLSALLPEPGTTIKGAMRTKQELLNKSGYARRPEEFNELIHVLDNKLRLVTPTEVVVESSDGQPVQSADGEKRYQLTHDYLVPSLREWLNSKQRETRKGRAELRLAERSAAWTDKPENRHLPSLREYLSIQFLTDKKDWTKPQRTMMDQARRLHGIRSGIVAAVLFFAGFTGMSVRHAVVESQNVTHAEGLVNGLVKAEITQVPAIITDLAEYRAWADPLLKNKFEKSENGSVQQLHSALALLPVDESKVDYLLDRLVVVTPQQFPVVRDVLLAHKTKLIEPLWSVALETKYDTPQRFQAACALATYSPDEERWNQISTLVADHLVTLQASEFLAWREALKPANGQLIRSLASIYRDRSQREQNRIYATEALADFAADRPDDLFDVLADAEQFQFSVIFGRLAAHQEKAVTSAQAELAKSPPEQASEDEKEALALRQANAAVALLKLGSPEKVWSLLKFSTDPRARSYIIHWLAALGVDPQSIIQRLDTETDVTARRALILTLGEFTDTQLPVIQRRPLIEKLLAVYETEPDAGLHGAVEWLLRKWGKLEQLTAVLEKLRTNEEQLRLRKATDKRHWYVNTESQTFVILNADEFVMGSPPSVPGWTNDEKPHRRRIGRRFAIATTEVTEAQCRRFRQTIDGINLVDPLKRMETSPVTGVTWYVAANYCNWLSEQEGIPKAQWCYEPDEDGDFGPGMKAKPKYLDLNGYRLPTEAEWEYACRAGTVTSHYYGLTETLLPQYAWCTANSQNRPWPVGSLKPNDFGLFDMLGNVWEWCDGFYMVFSNAPGTVLNDSGTTEPYINGYRYPLRGGAFNTVVEWVRSSVRNGQEPEVTLISFGFRPVRTYP